MHDNHDLPGWNPHNLQHCVDSVLLGNLTGVLAGFVLCWYIWIAWKWWESSKIASKECATLWRWLIVIFVVCALAGYASWIIALFVPKIAVCLRLIALGVLNIACPKFYSYAVSRKFMTIGRHERIGSVIAGSDPDKLSDKELATLARELVAISLGRIGTT